MSERVLIPELKRLARVAVADTGVPPMLLAACAVAESGDRANPERGCDPNAVRYEPHLDDESRGLCQILTHAAADVGADPARLFEPEYNLWAASRYLRACMRYTQPGGTERDRWMIAVAAYNCGMGRVRKAMARCAPGAHWSDVLDWLDGHPTQESLNERTTKRHVAGVLRVWNWLEADEDHEA